MGRCNIFIFFYHLNLHICFSLNFTIKYIPFPLPAVTFSFLGISWLTKVGFLLTCPRRTCVCCAPCTLACLSAALHLKFPWADAHVILNSYSFSWLPVSVAPLLVLYIAVAKFEITLQLFLCEQLPSFCLTAPGVYLYLYTPVTLLGCTLLTILTGTWWALWCGESGNFLELCALTLLCWIVLVFFSISDYARFRFALTAFHNHLLSNPLKPFPYFLWILFILLFLSYMSLTVFSVGSICSLFFGYSTVAFIPSLFLMEFHQLKFQFLLFSHHLLPEFGISPL